jgi:hypothetical protein
MHKMAPERRNFLFKIMYAFKEEEDFEKVSK